MIVRDWKIAINKNIQAVPKNVNFLPCLDSEENLSEKESRIPTSIPKSIPCSVAKDTSFEVFW